MGDVAIAKVPVDVGPAAMSEHPWPVRPPGNVPPGAVSRLTASCREPQSDPMAVNMRAMEEGTTRTRLRLDSVERFVPLRRELGVTTFGINQIVLEPGQRGRIHRHLRQEEVYLVLAGRLSLLIEGEETELETGELIRVAPALRRQLLNRGPQRLVLLALGGATEHEGRDGMAFASWEDHAGVPPQELALPADLPAAELR